MSRVLGAVAGAMMSVAVTLGVALAAGGPPVLLIPGLQGARVEVAGVNRLDDGGAVIAATISSSARAPKSHLAAVRLRVDGTVDLGYGALGISSPGLGPDVRATSLAVDPATGRAWLGITEGASRHGAIVALDAGGHQVRRFGHGGVRQLGPAGTGGPIALAWDRGELVAASGSRPCRGCTISLLNGSTGALLKTDTLTTSTTAPGAGGCATRAITGATFEGGRELLLTATAVSRGCGAQLLTLPLAAVARTGSSVLTPMAPLGPAMSMDMLASFSGSLCLAASGRSRSELGPLSADGALRGTTQGPPGQLTAVVALGQRACAALIKTARGGLVLQALGGERHPTRDRIPRDVTALGMFRCHQHLLVIGSRRRGSGRAGVVVAIPVRRGPAANRAAASATGCR